MSEETTPWRQYVDYRRRIWSRAWNDMLKIFGFSAATAWVVFITLISWFVLWRVFQWNLDKLNDEIMPAIALIAVFIVVSLGYLVFRALLLPAVIDGEQRAALEKCVERIRPRLKVNFIPGQEPFEHTEPMGCKGLARVRLFRIEIQNVSTEMLPNCFVELNNLSCGTAFPNVKLRQQGDGPYDPRQILVYQYKQEFSLLGEGRQLIDVVEMQELNPHSEIELCYATVGGGGAVPVRTIARQDVVLFITAYATTGQAVKTQFRVWVEDGYLRMGQLV